MNGFEKAAVDAAPRLGAAILRNLADRIAEGWPDHAILGTGSQRFGEAARPLLVARKESSVPDTEAGAFLRGIAAAQEQLATSVTVETVWSGPSSHAVPVRATAQALIEVIAEAKHKLLLMTYSAKPHEDIHAALTSAVARGVAVTVVVETLQGAGSALAGAEPAAAFSSIPSPAVALAGGPTHRDQCKNARQARRRRPTGAARLERKPHPVRRGQEHRGWPAGSRRARSTARSRTHHRAQSESRPGPSIRNHARRDLMAPADVTSSPQDATRPASTPLTRTHASRTSSPGTRVTAGRRARGLPGVRAYCAAGRTSATNAATYTTAAHLVAASCGVPGGFGPLDTLRPGVLLSPVRTRLRSRP